MGLKDLWDLKRLKVSQIIYQGSYIETTAAQKLNQGTGRQKGCNLLSGSFFWLLFLDNLSRFFGKQKK
jgi:hypothetical protein